MHKRQRDTRHGDSREMERTDEPKGGGAKTRGLGRHHVLFLGGGGLGDDDGAGGGGFPGSSDWRATATAAASRVPWAVVLVSAAQIVVELMLGRDQKLALALFKT